MPRRDVAGSYGSSGFSFLKDLHIDFYNGWTNSHLKPKWIRVPLSASSPAFVVLCFLDDSILTGVRWNLRVVLICVSMMGKDVEQV